METAFEKQLNPYTLNGLTENETCDRLIDMQQASQEDTHADVEPIQEPWEVRDGEDR